MSLFRIGLAAAAALLAGPASAQVADPLPAKHRVYVCERPTPARHVTHAEHGRLHFVSAKQLLSDAPPAAEPRCITAVELERLRMLTAQRSRTVASR